MLDDIKSIPKRQTDSEIMYEVWLDDLKQLQNAFIEQSIQQKELKQKIAYNNQTYRFYKIYQLKCEFDTGRHKINTLIEKIVALKYQINKYIRTNSYR